MIPQEQGGDADVTEDQIVRFVAKNLKLGTASGRFLLYHYVEGDSYQLPRLNTEVTLKVSGDAYPPLLRLVKAPRVIVTVERSRVTIVEPHRILRPMPRYELRRGNISDVLSVTSEASVIRDVHERLRTLPYHYNHRVKKYDYEKRQNVEEVHRVTPDKFLAIRPEGCGCCARIEFRDYISCPTCGKTLGSNNGRIPAYSMLFRSNLPVEGGFSHSLKDDVVTVYDKDGKVVIFQGLERLVKDMMSPNRPFKEASP